MKPQPAFSKLTLFDVDGTLLRTATGHPAAFVEGFRQVYGVDTHIDVIKHNGMTDQQVITEVLKKNGLDESEILPKLGDCMRVMVDYFKSVEDSIEVEVLSGVPELLAEFQKRNCLIGLVTGNLEPIAYGKMRRAGLRNYFSLGGFGSDHISRAELVKLAVHRAREQYGFEPAANVFHFGDAPQDMWAGSTAGVSAVGITTGIYTADELKAAGAWVVVESLADTRRIVEIIFG